LLLDPRREDEDLLRELDPLRRFVELELERRDEVCLDALCFLRSGGWGECECSLS
jgi:hypothetical protein